MPEDAFKSDAKLIETRDGSHTVYSSRFDQHYHNPNGAVTESRYVFFEKTGLLNALTKQDEITILEIGFGTGLNLMLLLDYYLECGSTAQINYYSIEGFPLNAATAADLNYEQHLEHPELCSDVTAIFQNLTEGINEFSLLESVNVSLFIGLFSDFPEENIGVQYIFHDAFSPDTNPELWTGDVFCKIKNISAEDVLLTTYCAASKAQGALAWAGWEVAKTQGALGKREMILAALDPEKLEDLKKVNAEHYARRYEEGDFD